MIQTMDAIKSEVVNVCWSEPMEKYVINFNNFNIFLTINEGVKYVIQLTMKLFVMTFICRIIHRETMPTVQIKELVYGMS